MTITSAFANLKKKTPDYDKLLKTIKGGKGEFKKDERFWTPTLNNEKIADAIIRFLPAPPNEDQAFVKIFSHGFKIGSKWYIEECPTTIDKECPVCEENSRLWDTKLPQNEEKARSRKRKAAYIANIYVVKDPNAPENEGKTFLFKVNLQTMGHIEEMLKPSIDREERVAVEDFWKGANYVLKVRRQGDFPSYKDSIFMTPGPLLKDDAALEKIWNNLHSLKEFVEDGPRFKPYDELKRKFDQVLLSTGAALPSAAKLTLADDEAVKEADRLFGSADAPASRKAAPPSLDSDTPPWEDKPGASVGSELDQFMSFLKEED